MFTVADHAAESVVDLSVEPAPTKVFRFPLEDEALVLPGQNVVEYDLTYLQMPADLERIIKDCFRAARDAGVRVAWFAFEGSFHFDFILTESIADQVYAVMDSRCVSIASDETLHSKEWAARVAEAGAEVHRG